MNVMLDTNICIYLIKQVPPALIQRLGAFPVGDIGISVIRGKNEIVVTAIGTHKDVLGI
jgi:predicted nucleic acid-binding protein